MGVEDGLEMLVEVLDRHVTQPVEDASDPHPGVGVWVGSPSKRYLAVTFKVGTIYVHILSNTRK